MTASKDDESDDEISSLSFSSRSSSSPSLPTPSVPDASPSRPPPFLLAPDASNAPRRLPFLSWKSVVEIVSLGAYLGICFGIPIVLLMDTFTVVKDSDTVDFSTNFELEFEMELVVILLHLWLCAMALQVIFNGLKKLLISSSRGRRRKRGATGAGEKEEKKEQDKLEADINEALIYFSFQRACENLSIAAQAVFDSDAQPVGWPSDFQWIYEGDITAIKDAFKAACRIAIQKGIREPFQEGLFEMVIEDVDGQLNRLRRPFMYWRVLWPSLMLTSAGCFHLFFTITRGDELEGDEIIPNGDVYIPTPEEAATSAFLLELMGLEPPLQKTLVELAYATEMLVRFSGETDADEQ